MTNGLRQWFRDPERWLQLLTIVGGLAAFGIGLHEYREDQRWKRLEYFSGMLQSIEGEAEVRSALIMLEYNQPRVCAREEVAEGPRCFTASDSLVTAALDAAMHNRVLGPEEHQVVYAIDRFLTALDRLDYLQAGGFVDEEVRHPTIAYWIALVGDRRNHAKPPAVRAKLCEYVRFFEYAGTLRLIARYTPPGDRIPQCTAPADARS
ncbi:hypothetical protein SAMN05216486_10833 [bacterium JGI 053]|nr:hypothetical protein SAMN05216486_10833 [bacterium JGI 053]